MSIAVNSSSILIEIFFLEDDSMFCQSERRVRYQFTFTGLFLPVLKALSCLDGHIISSFRQRTSLPTRQSFLPDLWPLGRPLSHPLQTKTKYLESVKFIISHHYMNM